MLILVAATKYTLHNKTELEPDCLTEPEPLPNRLDEDYYIELNLNLILIAATKGVFVSLVAPKIHVTSNI